jgi:serine/threonine-protein kinase HipA
LAPAYDLPSTLFYGDSSFALPMVGKRRDISRSQLLAFAKTLGLATPSATRVLDTLLDATGDLEADLRAGALPFDQRSVADTVASLRNRRRLLAR